MRRIKAPFRDFDLPVKHLGESDHFVPPKARDAAEIARRRNLKPGALLAEHQLRGIQVAARVLSFAAERGENDDFLTGTLAAAEFNTAWYNHSAGARDVMRRRLKLPKHDEDPAGLDTGLMLAAGSEDLQASLYDANLLTKYPGMPRFMKRIGIRIGDASLHLASINRQPELIKSADDAFLTQVITRRAALDVIEASRHMHLEVHANPSLAQLADPDSPLSHYWRVSGSDFAVQALQFATSPDSQRP